MQGYRHRNAYIATQTPMENTVNDFWRMILEHQSRCIVMLCRMMEKGEVRWEKQTHLTIIIMRYYGDMTFNLSVQEQCHDFLPPNRGNSETYGRVTVKLVSQDITTDVIINYLELSEYNSRPQSGTSQCTATLVTLFKYMHWSKVGTPQGTSTFLELMGDVNRVQMSSGNQPITVMCKWEIIVIL